MGESQGASARGARTRAKPHSLRLGSRYRIIEKLGEGTFGEVFRVKDRLLGEELALKRFKSVAASIDVREMLREEFLLLARLRHPGIPKVHDVSVGAGVAPFFTMEYLRGGDIAVGLRGRRSGPIAPDRIPAAVSAFLTVLSALRYLHARGIDEDTQVRGLIPNLAAIGPGDLNH